MCRGCQVGSPFPSIGAVDLSRRSSNAICSALNAFLAHGILMPFFSLTSIFYPAAAALQGSMPGLHARRGDPELDRSFAPGCLLKAVDHGRAAPTESRRGSSRREGRE